MIRLGLIGYPLSHSFSPKLHIAALKACGLQGDYLLYPVSPDDNQTIKGLLQKVRIGELIGLNVTIPHKKNIIKFLDELTPNAGAIGAVNTIYFTDEKLMGDNTDAPGFFTDLTGFLQESSLTIKGNCGIKEQSALIIGAGGSARAVAYALLRAGWTITVASRQVEKAQEFQMTDLQVTKYDLLHLAEQISDFQLIVNATPIGMYPITDVSPWIDGLDFPKGAVVYDLIYNPRVTLLVKQARAAGLQARNGLGMLIEQAALAFHLWTGYDISRTVMYDALNEESLID